MEIWKPIKDFEQYYMISNYGNVKALKRKWTQKHYSGALSVYEKPEKLLTIQKGNNGYCYIDLHADKKVYRKLIHRLVAEAFIENANNYNYINHIDNNPNNNRADNLEWCSQSYNIQYAYNNGRKIPPHTKKVKQIDLTTKKVVNIYNSIEEARRITKLNNISACCRGLRQKAGGYIWQYA